MLSTRPLALVLALSLFACSKGTSKTPAATPMTTRTPPVAPPPAPASVPQSLVDRIQREWPEVERAGKAFDVAFAEATSSRDAGDRDKMDASINIAQRESAIALDTWGEIAYSIEDMTDTKVADACRKYIRDKDKIVSGWMSKAKALAQFSRVK